MVNTPSAAIILTRFKAQTKITLVQELKAKGISCADMYLDSLIGGIFESVQAWAKTWKISQISALKSELNQIAKTILKFEPKSIWSELLQSPSPAIAAATRSLTKGKSHE